MLETYFFVLGAVDSLVLIIIFLVRKKRLDLVKRYGWFYLLLSLPAVLGLFWALRQGSSKYAIFLGIFLAYLLMEYVFDHVIKPGFRENWRRDWRLLTPYLVLYYAINYGFIVMPWTVSRTWGVIMLGLFIIQIFANLWSHTFSARNRSSKSY
jgi:hypothetical protein